MSVSVDGGRGTGGSATVRALRRPRLDSHGRAVAAAQRFAEQIAAEAIERDRRGRLPVREMAVFDASGLLAITIPAGAGGVDLPVATLAEVVRTIAAADSAVAQTPQGHYLMVDVVATAGTAAQRARLFGDVVAGSRIASALAERGSGHAQDLRTRLCAGAQRTVLSGRKYYATGALTADWLGVTALDPDDRQALAFVRRDAAGVTLSDDWDVMGQRATVSGSVEFDDVEVDPDLIVPYWQCFERPQQLGARAQLYHAAIQVGIAAGALADARWFVTERARPFFEASRAGWADTAAEDPYVIYRFGALATQVRAAEALLTDAAATLDEVGRVPADADAAARGSAAVAQASAFASEVGVSVSSQLCRPPMSDTTPAVTGATRAPTPATTRSTGNTTTSATTSSAACSHPTTDSCDGGTGRPIGRAVSGPGVRGSVRDGLGGRAAPCARSSADRGHGRDLAR
jgi:alkylation response protein AidB-like acyl-CoA dehydrogenase